MHLDGFQRVERDRSLTLVVVATAVQIIDACESAVVVEPYFDLGV